MTNMIGDPSRQTVKYILKDWVLDLMKSDSKLDLYDAAIISKISFFQSQGKECHISDGTIAEELNLNVKAIQKRMKKLSDNGYIIRDTITKKGESGAGRTRAISLNTAKLQTENEKTTRPEAEKTTQPRAVYENNNPPEGGMDTRPQAVCYGENNPPEGGNNRNYSSNGNIIGYGADAPSCSVSQEEKSHEGKSTTNSIKESPEEYEGVDEFTKFTELLSPFKIDVSQRTIKQIKKACAESCKDADPEFSFYALENLVDEKIKTVIVDPNKDNEGYRFGILMNTIKSSYDQYMRNQIRYRYEREELIQQTNDLANSKIIRIEAHLQQDFNKRKADREDEELMREFLEDEDEDEPDTTQTSSSASSGTSSPQEDSFDDLDFDVEISEDFDVEYNLN